MELLCDEINGVYVWIGNNDNEIVELSPHFDYEEDAITWQVNQNTNPSEWSWLN